MNLPQRYTPAEAETRWQQAWNEQAIYRFDPQTTRPIFAIDTPPPTVSGALHIGHVYSYIQAEAMVRFWRMRGFHPYYPFGFDDNGLPTERFVERAQGITPREVGRDAFIAACLRETEATEARFEAFWQRLGISADWSLRYSTISALARHAAQWSFLDLFRKGRIYQAQAPNPWCWECGTAIAQAEMEDAERDSTFYTLRFGLAEGELLIATTRPELLPACVAVFVHPEDARFQHLIGSETTLPLFGRQVPILADTTVDPAKGTGAVMCCTFGDTADVAWWRAHNLPLIPLLTREGRLSEHGGAYAGLYLKQARTRLLADLREAGLLAAEQPTRQSVRVHERCGTPLEILETRQWFIRVLDLKPELLAAGRAITWHPEFMRTRYEHWVEHLAWDWCISRQRVYGVPFPLWQCAACGEVVLAEPEQLPIDPLSDQPPRACACGGTLQPETDVMDTWATSSVSPQIAGRMLEQPDLFGRLFPMALRPQAHDIIRTWAFDTIVKSLLHHNQVPWNTLLISGHALDPAGRKLSKSKGNAPTSPDSLIERYGADAVRYWSCGGAPGADQLLDEESMRRGVRLLNKLWNAGRLIASASSGETAEASEPTPTDRAMRSWLGRLVQAATAAMERYDYPAALAATEQFFWSSLCDNYLELAKGRLYDGSPAERAAVLATLHDVFSTVLRLLAPFLPHITEELWSFLYAGETGGSIHLAAWPEADPAWFDSDAEQTGAAIFALLGQVRRSKSERKLGPGAPLALLTLEAPTALHPALAASATDIRSATRAAQLTLTKGAELRAIAEF